MPRTLALSPEVPPPLRPLLASLSAQARTRRAASPPNSPASQASSQLNTLCASLYSRGVPIRSLARAASITPRAMRARVEAGLSHVTHPAARP